MLRLVAVLQAHPHRRALPSRRGTLRVRIVTRIGRARLFFQYRFAPPYLENNGVKFLAIFRNAAISPIVSIPTSRRIDKDRTLED